MRKMLFFDTETTGKPKDYRASYEDLDNWPRIIEIAWRLIDEAGNQISAHRYLIKPDGWIMPTDEFWIKNGFTQEENLEKGHPIAEVLDLFLADCHSADFLVAHNVGFDHPLTWAEILRAGKQPRTGMVKICTMMKTIKYVGAKYTNGRAGKFPSLTELHTKLFGTGFDGAHGAEADMIALVNCFFKLVELGIISLDRLNLSNQ